VSTFISLNAIAGAYVERSPVVVISATPGADARRITDMYGVLYHHSTGNLAAEVEIYKQVTVSAETLSTSAGAAEKSITCSSNALRTSGRFTSPVTKRSGPNPVPNLPTNPCSRGN